MKIQCLQCKSDVEAIRKTRKFCSQECADTFRYIPKPRKIHIKKCSFCGIDTRVPPHRLKFKKNYCSRVCHTGYLKKNGFVLKCVSCKKNFKCNPADIKWRNRMSCSISCRSAYRQKKAEERRRSGVYTKHQLDRIYRYSLEAKNWRKAVFSRDDYTCQGCGVRGTYLEAHHILPFAYFPEKRCDISNGKTLCKKCHGETKVHYSKLKVLYGQK